MRVNVTVCDMTFRNDLRTRGLLLMSSKNEVVVHGSADLVPASQQHKGNSEWETLGIYLVYIFLILSFLYPLDPFIFIMLVSTFILVKYLQLQEKYRGFHAKLPVIVAETLLSADPEIELPLWLVQMFKVLL